MTSSTRAPFSTRPTFHTSRLVYRAIDPTSDVDLFLRIKSDPLTSLMGSPEIVLPCGRTKAQQLAKGVAEQLFSVAICLPASPSEPTLAGESIGYIYLESIPPSQMQHRNTAFSMSIVKEYQGKGYGSEALEWMLESAFLRYGLHKVSCYAAAENVGGIKMYQKLGFKLEVIFRKSLFKEGEWQDRVALGLLENEWRARKRLTALP